MFRNLIALAPKKKAVAAVVATSKTSRGATKRSPSPKRKATLAARKCKSSALSTTPKGKRTAPRTKSATVTKKKQPATKTNNTKATTVSFALLEADIQSALRCQVCETTVKTLDFDFVDAEAVETSTAATVHLTKNDDACFTAPTPMTEEHPGGEPSAESVATAIAECEAVESEATAEIKILGQTEDLANEEKFAATEDLSMIGTFSEEPTDNIAAIFEPMGPTAAEQLAATEDFSAVGSYTLLPTIATNVVLSEADRYAATEDLSMVGSFSEEPTDPTVLAAFDRAAWGDQGSAGHFETEGLEIAPAEAEFECKVTPTSRFEPSIAVSTITRTEHTPLPVSAPAVAAVAAAETAATEEESFGTPDVSPDF